MVSIHSSVYVTATKRRDALLWSYVIRSMLRVSFCLLIPVASISVHRRVGYCRATQRHLISYSPLSFPSWLLMLHLPRYWQVINSSLSKHWDQKTSLNLVCLSTLRSRASDSPLSWRPTWVCHSSEEYSSCCMLLPLSSQSDLSWSNS